MKRREFITSLAVLGCAALVPLPKTPRPLTSRHYCEIIQDDLVTSPPLTPEMLDRVFEYFAKETIEHIRFYHKRDKHIMDLLKR